MNDQLSHTEIERIIDEQERELDLLLLKQTQAEAGKVGSPLVASPPRRCSYPVRCVKALWSRLLRLSGSS